MKPNKKIEINMLKSSFKKPQLPSYTNNYHYYPVYYSSYPQQTYYPTIINTQQMLNYSCYPRRYLMANIPQFTNPLENLDGFTESRVKLSKRPCPEEIKCKNLSTDLFKKTVSQMTYKNSYDFKKNLDESEKTKKNKTKSTNKEIIENNGKNNLLKNILTNKKDKLENLINVSIKLISNQIITEHEFKMLSKDCIQKLTLFLLKRNLLTNENCFILGNLDSNGYNEFCQITNKMKTTSNIITINLAETILNRALRTYFDEWKKKADLSQMVPVNNFRINKLFWKDVLESTGNKNFEEFYSNIKTKFQILKKKLKKNSVSGPKKKAKFLNLVFTRNLINLTLYTLKDNTRFSKIFKNIKEEIRGKYLNNKEEVGDLDTDTYHNKDELKFNLNLKLLCKKMYGSISKRYLLPMSYFTIPEDLQSKMKNVYFPITLKDYENVFESIDKHLD